MNRIKVLLNVIRKKPINLVLICVVGVLYMLNNNFLKSSSPDTVRWFFISYFNDLICPLLFFSYVNILLLTKNLELSRLRHIIPFCVVVSVVWEFGAPLFKPSSTTDFLDIVCYFKGSISYWWILKKVNNKADCNK